MQSSQNERFLGKVHIHPRVPEELKGLEELSRNLWWTWHPRARELFRLIAKPTWIETKGNAVRFLRNVSQKNLDEAARDEQIRERYEAVMRAYRTYMEGKQSWWRQNYAESDKNALIAYFSAEYGLHEILQTYSGGLGVLSGDHCKSASDLGLPMIAIGLIYREGYFQQELDAQGQQVARYSRQRWEELPVNEVLDSHHRPVEVKVELPGRLVTLKVWAINVGRIPIYVMDADIPANADEDRKLTARLYGGDTETRIQQEIILGIGGQRVIRELVTRGIITHEPTLYHMNEGHSAFLSLERLRHLVQNDKLSLLEATEVIRASSLFTTHTPVPAGHDRFGLDLIDKYFGGYYKSLGLSPTQFFDFGLEVMPDGGKLFSMTVLALHFAAQVNGVSELHGEVSRKMLAGHWKDVPASEAPIDFVTNGVHTRTWMSFDMQNLFDKHVGSRWRERISDPRMWDEFVTKVSDTELWATMGDLKSALIRFIHDRLRRQHMRFGETSDQLEQLEGVFTPNALTIGFARRFATYKRATLIFRDADRLARIINDPQRPVQLVFSGKAHPADRPGQEFIKRIIEFSKDPRFRNRLVFLENYDMNIGRRLTSGVDVWLNNPRRPYEASGTSGMKVPLNGGLNCSILDGWWPEAYRTNPLVGWALGYEKVYANEDQQDAEDADHLYRTLEKEIVPLYYERDENNIPRGWLKRVREAMRTCGPMFSMDRQVKEYTDKFYLRGSRRFEELNSGNWVEAKAMASVKSALRRAWPQVEIVGRVLTEMPANAEMYSVGTAEGIRIRAEVFLASLTKEDVVVEIFAEEPHHSDKLLPKVTRQEMKYVGEEVIDGKPRAIYQGEFVMEESGEHLFTVRVVPRNTKEFTPHETGLVRWPRR